MFTQSAFSSFDRFLLDDAASNSSKVPDIKKFSDSLPDGTYTATLFAVRVGQTKAGDPCMWANFEVLAQDGLDARYVGSVLVRQWTLNERAAPFFAADLQTLGVKIKGFGELFAEPEKFLVGLTAELEVHNVFNGTYQTMSTNCRILGLAELNAIVAPTTSSRDSEAEDFEL